MSSTELLNWSDVTGAPNISTISAIQRAFGYDGLGLLLVRGVPGLEAARGACLPFARLMALLPEDTKKKYVHAASSYSFGWSHGKENFNGVPDRSKGSFYFNPIHDIPEDDPAQYTNPALSPFLHPNIWPDSDLSGFEGACKTLSRLMVNAGVALSRHVDAYVEEQSASWGSSTPTTSRTLHSVVTKSRTHKARLLYYFPSSSSLAESGSDATLTPWCGAHNDHGSLTALTSAAFFKEDTGELLQGCPDPNAGLYIRSRKGETVRAVIPADCLAFQIGECAQVHSGGALQVSFFWASPPLLLSFCYAIFIPMKNDQIDCGSLGEFLAPFS